MKEPLTLEFNPSDLVNWELAAKHLGISVAQLVAESTNRAVTLLHKQRQRDIRRKAAR
jgi:hypothetical protein